ncbi:MAG: hypothetical protein K5756_08830 [Clostridiales bacterium]|nr:hypothetical protein [Clostridiales bacterium]
MKEVEKLNKNSYNEAVKYVPFDTVEECEEYARRFVGSGYSPTFKNEIVYKGISIEHANEVNEALYNIYRDYDLSKLNGIRTISPTSLQGKKVFKDGADAVAAYNPVEHGIFLNKDILKNAETLSAYNRRSDEAWKLVMQNIDNLSGSQLDLALTYQRAGRALVGDGSVSDYITHEMGHHVQWEALDATTNNAIGRNMSTYAPKISGYANSSNGEYIAESFVAHVKGETELIDPVFSSFLENKTVSSAKILKPGESLEFAKRGTSSFETIILPKDEYAHVMSEIATNLTVEQSNHAVFKKCIGNYVYTVENNGFGNYRIIGKKIIK